jgi:hypothetical protein
MYFNKHRHAVHAHVIVSLHWQNKSFVGRQLKICHKATSLEYYEEKIFSFIFFEIYLTVNETSHQRDTS